MNKIDDPVVRKLEILADAAKYDASCASSGARSKGKREANTLGSKTGAGICHAYTPDGRCISLLKILLTNFCVYDCAYCINRSSSNVERARFTSDEVVALTLGFYKRNMIEGLFLSSGIIRNEDYTMEQMVRVAEALRRDHGFRGYIHLKTIAGASPDLLQRAGAAADRLSVNIELADDDSLRRLAPEKKPLSIRRSMAAVRAGVEDAADARRRSARAPSFAPAGQSTQLIIGADASDDALIMKRSAALYSTFALRRVYYSAFSPIPDVSVALPAKRPPLMREHRLYQADWLMRFYGFSAEEIFEGSTGMLDLVHDPKLAWALRRRETFPLDVNLAPREMLLRVPGLGVRVVDRILSTRRHVRLRLADLARLCRSIEKVRPFVVTDDWRPHGPQDPMRSAFAAFVAPPQQLDLFAP